MSATIKLNLNENLYLRDPQDTDLGRRIVSASIDMIDRIGFENYTFKKLSEEINSTEASIYRYFENKHRVLTYITSWYWAWLSYQIDYAINNVKEPKERLFIIIKLISAPIFNDPMTLLDEKKLHNIIIYQSSKAYLTSNVDEDNKDGLFAEYKALCNKIALLVHEINPNYKYPNTFTSMLLETAHDQIFFAKHLPALTNIEKGKDVSISLSEYLENLVTSVVIK